MHIPPSEVLGRDRDDFVPGGLRHRLPFWNEVILYDHPNRKMILRWTAYGVSVYEFLIVEARGVAPDQQCLRVAFRGEVYPNRVGPKHVDFAVYGINVLCPGLPDSVGPNQSPSAPRRSRLIEAVSMEPVKPRMIGLGTGVASQHNYTGR